MSELPRLNGAIRALETAQIAFTTFSPPEIGSALSISTAPYDAVVFEMEHNPYDITTLRHCLQYLLNRRQIVEAGSLAPAVTPFVRIPPNGGEHQPMAGQASAGYRRLWRHLAACQHSGRGPQRGCRLPLSPPERSAPLFSAGATRGRTDGGGALLGPTGPEILQAGRCLAAGAGWGNPGGDHV